MKLKEGENMKLVYKIFTLCFVLGLFFFNATVLPLHTSAAANPVIGLYDSDGNVKGKAGIILKADLTEADLDLLGEDFLNDMMKYGWEQTEAGIQKFYPAQPNSLVINGEDIAIVGDGEFSITEETEELDIEFNANGQTLNTTVKINNDLNEIDIIKTLDFNDFISDMNPEEIENTISPMSEVGEKQYPGDYVHCNRFNGIFSDNVYWPSYHPQAIKNFVSSDCDLAFTAYACWNDFTSDTNCRGLQAAYNYTNCSKALGHTQRFHWYDN